jgi:phosphoribosylamine--glycine ligase
MGAYTPASVYTREAHEFTLERILKPTVRGMYKADRPFQGVLYAGLMITKEGPKVLEYNARFGDPETQPLMLRLESDLADLMLAVADGELHRRQAFWSPQPAVCVVLASGGYPGEYQKGLPITGLDGLPPGVQAFHAGTAIKDGAVVTAGGRVLGVTARDENLRAAIELAYRGVKRIQFPGMHYRIDIGHRALV